MKKLGRALKEMKGVFKLTSAQDLMSKERYDEAVKILSNFEFHEQQLSEALILLGNCSYRLKKFGDALDYYEKAIENEEIGGFVRKSDDKAYLIGYCRIYLAAAEKRLGVNHKQEDIDVLKEKLKNMPRSKTIGLAFSI